MEVELQEIRQFLAQRAPFNTLADEQLDELPKEMEIRYLRRNSEFPPADDYLYVIRSGAIELRDKDGEICEKLAEGNLYSVSCQILAMESDCTGIAAEDTLLYLLPCTTLRALCRANDEFNAYFETSIRDRLKQAVTVAKGNGGSDMPSMTIEIGDLLSKAPITVPPSATIREVAELMTDKGVSSVMVTENNQLLGLITDRDVRSRCVAAGLSVFNPASEIMTPNPQAIQVNSLMMQALMTMTRLKVHHLPVMRGDELVGMITATDLSRQQSTNPAYIATDIRKAKTLDDLVYASKKLPELQLQLVNAHASALHIGEAISCITDALTCRLLKMAEEELGPPPVPYCWLAGGSQARHEQSSHSDQDNALLISDEMQPEHDAYFKALAQRVSDGLNACGFIYCPGDAMATNDKWRQPLRVWRQYFSEWIEKPEPMALMLSSIFFDLRAVAGDVSLFQTLQREVRQKSQANRIFIAFMAANALQHQPPIGFFRRFVLIRGGDHDDTFDIKHRGIVTITDLARVYALSKGIAAVNTTDRLRRAAEIGALSHEMAENLEDALEFIATLRIRHQAEQIRAGKPADNYLHPEALSELEREHLRDAFGIIKTMQESLGNRYQAGRFR